MRLAIKLLSAVLSLSFFLFPIDQAPAGSSLDQDQVADSTESASYKFTAIAAGWDHSLALRWDGSIVGWGCNGWRQATPPPGNDYIAIAAGGKHSLALRWDGSIVGWGRNDDGQASPPAGNDFIAIAGGGQPYCCGYSLALRSNGSIVGWGDNGFGQATPPPGNDYVAIAAGWGHGLALRTDGSIVGWGDNWCGQAAPPAGNDFIAIAAARDHSLALKADHSIVSWGCCGDPPGGHNYVTISTGSSHHLALRADGSIAGWGDDWYGQATPPAGDYIAVGAGANHSLALKIDGSIVGWGDDGYGQADPPVVDEIGPTTPEEYAIGEISSMTVRDGDYLILRMLGSGQPFSFAADPQPCGPISLDPLTGLFSYTPGSEDKRRFQVTVTGPGEGGAVAIAIAAGEFHSLGLKADGSIAAWGDNGYGQLNIPSPNRDFVGIAAGYWHNLGLKVNGSIVAWGHNGYGQCNIASPNRDFVAIAAGEKHSLALKADGSIVGWGDDGCGQCDVPAGNDYVAIAAGRHHSLALRSDGSIVSWGFGHLGMGTPPAGKDFIAIAAGGEHRLALKADGCIIGWGSNTDGAHNWLGQATPPDGNDFIAIAAGWEHSLALKADGSIVGWGANYWGQAHPPAGNNFIAIAGGVHHSLALKADGSIVGWGDNYNGQATPPVTTVSQVFEITPMPHVPPEHRVIGLEPFQPVPPPDSRDYILVNDISGSVGTVTISGKKIVIEPGNWLHTLLNGNTSIRQVNIYAEMLGVVGVDVPQATVNIYARAVLGSPYFGARINIFKTEQANRPPDWLHPSALRMVLAHAKDAYLYGHLDYARGVFEDYIGILDRYRASGQWNGLPEEWRLEFEQMHNEMQVLLHRITSNLDYFGNPAGWVPMLSFEVTKLAYENEISRAMRVLYLDYWVENKAERMQERIGAFQTAREEFIAEVEDFREQYDAATRIIPALEAESVEILERIESVQTELKELEQTLIERAQHIVEERHKPPKLPWWKKALRTVGSICKVFPIGQPVLGSVGTGLDVISHVGSKDPWSSVAEIRDVAKDFNDVNFKQTADNFKSKLAEFDPAKIKNVGDARDYIQNLRDFGNEIADALKPLESTVRKTQVPDKEVQAELDKIRAKDPQFSGLVKKVGELAAQKQVFAQQLAEATQAVSTLSDNIQHNLLAIDAMNYDIANLSLAYDQRAVTYVREMGERAKQRLLKYHYYMAKAYEYRLLEPYPFDLNIERVFTRMQQILDYPLGSDSEGHVLGPQDFEALKAVYEEQLSSLTEAIYTAYIEGIGSEYSALTTLALTQEELVELNAGEPVCVNWMKAGRFQPDEENIRITDVTVVDMDTHLEGAYGHDDYFDLRIQHCGLSNLQKDAETYRFVHYKDDAENPVNWNMRYIADGRLVPIDRSDASKSLLWSLLEKFTDVTPNDALLFSRPAAWADISIRKVPHPGNVGDTVIDSLRLETDYDFTYRPTSIKTLSIFVSPEGFLPYFILEKVDLNGREDGRGDFCRAYAKDEVVTLKAPVKYGEWRFQKWTDRFGRDLGADPLTNPALEVELSNDIAICAKYTIAGDVDLNSAVDLTDFSIFASAWQTEPGDAAWNAECDVSTPADNRVDMRDLIVFVSHWLAGIE